MTVSPRQEAATIELLASEYEARGYTVIREPLLFPDFLQKYRPDMVAISPNDKVVLEIKVRDAPIVDPKIHNIARVVREHPGWRFEFVAVEKQETEPISEETAYRMFLQASQFNENHYNEAALITGWASAEAILRNLLESDSYDGQSLSSLSPLQMVKTAFSAGLISREVSDVMLAAIAVRNPIAHGLRYTGPGSVETVATSLLRAIVQLLPSEESGHSNRTIQSSPEEMVAWFHQNYEDPAKGVPYESAEGGYIYYLGGPYDPWEVLWEQFPDAESRDIEAAVSQILPQGVEWIRKGQY